MTARPKRDSFAPDMVFSALSKRAPPNSSTSIDIGLICVATRPLLLFVSLEGQPCSEPPFATTREAQWANTPPCAHSRLWSARGMANVPAAIGLAASTARLTVGTHGENGLVSIKRGIQFWFTRRRQENYPATFPPCEGDHFANIGPIEFDVCRRDV
jgi:hypothetical protein